MQKLAFGRLGISPADFWLMSPRELSNHLAGWLEAEEWRQKQDWERARYVAKSIVSVQVEKKDRHKVEKAFRLPWDGEKTGSQAKRLTPEKAKEQEEKTIRMAEKIQKILG